MPGTLIKSWHNGRMKYFVPPILAILITSGAWPSQSHQTRNRRAGRYDFQLHWQPDLAAGVPTTPDAEPLPDIFTAFQQQLGLRLQATRAVADTLVIDKVERPTAN